MKIAYLRFCEKLQRADLPRELAEGPVDYARRLAGARPDLAGPVAAITKLYVDLRYGPAPDGRRLRELRLRVREFAWRNTVIVQQPVSAAVPMYWKLSALTSKCRRTACARP